MMTSLILITLIYLNFVHRLSLAQDNPKEEVYSVEYDGFSWRNVSEYLAMIFTEKYVCLCSLLTLDFCITGAECFEFDNDTSKMFVIAGSTNFTRFDPRAQVRKIKKIIVHEGYRPGGYLGTDDIAIVELSYPLYENIRIKTLNLPTRYMLNNGTNFAVISSSTLDAEPSVYGTIVRFKIYIVPNFACACNDSVHDLTTIYDEEGNVIARFICFHYYEVGGGENPHIHCKDAAGGPLTIDDTLIAIQTGQYHVDGCKKNEKGQFERIPCDNTSTEAGYLQIYSYIDWINKYIPRRKATLRRPRTTVKNYHIDIKPLLPLILCAALYFIIIMIVLVCCLGILPKLN